MPTPEPIDENLMIARARSAVTKIDRHGKRGVTLISMEEIEAMALTLACLGVFPRHAGDRAAISTSTETNS